MHCERRHRLGIGQAAFVECSVERILAEQIHFQEFACIEPRTDMRQAARRVDRDPFGRIRDHRVHDAEARPVQRAVPGFLDELAHARLDRRFARIELARRKFEERPIRRVAELPFDDEPPVVGHRHDEHRAGMHDVLAHRGTAVRHSRAVAPHVEQRTVIHLLAAFAMLDERSVARSGRKRGARIIGRGLRHASIQSRGGRKSV